MPAWEQASFYLLSGKHMAPLWFIPMIVLVFVASPLFVFIDRRKLYWLAAPLALVFSSLVDKDFLPGSFNLLGRAIYMLAPYIAGMAFAHYRLEVEAWSRKNLLLLFMGFSASCALTYFNVHDFSVIENVLMAIILMALLKRWEVPHKLSKHMARLAELSFAIFFLHGYVITAFKVGFNKLVNSKLSADSALFGPSAPGLILFVALVLTVSVILIEVGRKILGRRSRMLIGA